MEDIKKNELEGAKEVIREALAPGGAVEAMLSAEAEKKKRAEELKEKYGNVYSVSMTVPVDDTRETELSYYFKRPSVPSYDRYIKDAAKSGITKASKVFMLDCVVEEDRERLIADMEMNPGVAITIGNKLTEIMGLTGTANLTKL